MTVFSSVSCQRKNAASMPNDEKELFKEISTQDSDTLLKKEVWQISAKEKKLFKQIIAQDSGFLLKKEALLILSMAEVIDSTNKDHEKYIKECDTIAKYYKKSNGNYIFSIKYDVDGLYHSHILIECSPKGKILKKEIYYHGTMYCLENYYKNFNKFGDFFSLGICSGGMGSSDYFLYIFKEITPEDSLNMIPFYCWISAEGFYDEMSDGKSKEMSCYGTIKKIENDSLIISYKQKYDIYVMTGKGRDIKSELLETIERDSFDVLYIYKKNQWRIANREDYKKLGKCGYDMNIYLKYR